MMTPNKSTKDNTNNITATVDYDPHIEAYVVDTKDKDTFEDDTQGNFENCGFFLKKKFE